MDQIVSVMDYGGEAEELAGQSLAIGCFGSICRDRLGDELLNFARICPEVGLGVHEMSRGALISALESEELALAVLPGGDRPGLQSALLWSDRVMVALPPDHPLASFAMVTPAQLQDQVFLVSRQHRGGDVHRFLSERINPLGPPLNGSLLNLDPGQRVERVAMGEGLALVCASQVDHGHREVALRPINAPGAIFSVFAHWKDPEPIWPLSMLIHTLEASCQA